jgi:hypothetical protein
MAWQFLRSSNRAQSETRLIHAENTRLTAIVLLARGMRSDDV